MKWFAFSKCLAAASLVVHIDGSIGLAALNGVWNDGLAPETPLAPPETALAGPERIAMTAVWNDVERCRRERSRLEQSRNDRRDTVLQPSG